MTKKSDVIAENARLKIAQITLSYHSQKAEAPAKIEAEIEALTSANLSRDELIVECATYKVKLSMACETLSHFLPLATIGAEAHDALSEITKEAQRQGALAVHKAAGHEARKKTIKEIWASGKYKTRTACAQNECKTLGMSFDTARRALRNTPDNS